MTPRRKFGIVLLLAAAAWGGVALLAMGAYNVAHAAEVVPMEDSPTCWSWNGGNHSSGSFIKCTPEMRAAAKQVAATIPAPLAAQPQPGMVMVPMAPLPMVHHLQPRKRKPKPRMICRPL
jgi:hypothetical protein